MKVVIFGALFIVLHLINAVFGSLRFNKDQEVFTTVEILSPVVGLAMSIMFMMSYLLNTKHYGKYSQANRASWFNIV